MRDMSDFHKISINLASPDRIREWSYGEVKKPETINYRTLRPERDGLFCERIFGTTKEWECYCGKFKSIRYKGVICDRCGVEVAHFKVRRERMGHIELATPVSHIWYYKSVPSRIGLILGLSINEIRSILYFEKYVVIDPGDTDLEFKQLLSEDDYMEIRDKYGSAFTVDIGANAIKVLLETVDLDTEAEILREKMIEKGERSEARLLKRLEIIEDFRRSSNLPVWLILEVVPVIPPELRPMVQLDGGRFATSDLNDLYRRVINRNNRLKRLLTLKAPEIIIRNEKRMLQEAVDALFDNSRRKRVVKGPGNRPLKSLSDMLKGKSGRFRQNLLGKRVDYSGRSVIVVGPELKLHQCGLPKKMALELFKPFIMRELVERDMVYNIKSAKKWVEKERDEVWNVLEEVITQHPVLLNRAPTLHRLGIQAFEPVLVEGKAIRLHPLVCTAFNADFDGDQMAVHVPLSPEAQIECWLLMLSSKNLLNPANGQPIVVPTQDMILGIYSLTKERPGAKGEGKRFTDEFELEHALNSSDVSHQALIHIRHRGKWLQTTPGRFIFNKALPESHDFVNDNLNNKGIQQLILKSIKRYGSYITSVILDKVKTLGFRYSTFFGASIGINDIKIPAKKQKLLEEAEEKVMKVEAQSQKGVITDDERYNKIIDIWTHVNDKVTASMMEEIKEDKNGFNNLFIMASSGARGSKQQIRQLAGMRGLMAKPSGEILELPIKSNFKEGLTVLEYFISTHGARKGLADTALKTADAGYLTRRLVDIAQDVVITMDDCGTINGIEVAAVYDGDELIESLSDRIIGRTVIEDIYHPKSQDLIVGSNTEINEKHAEEIEKAGFDRIRTRTVFTCEARHGVCVKCYGKNLATNKTVEVGEAVGTIAAQSIGQPGTQLTMRTFHIGGIADKSVEEENLRLTYPCVLNKLPSDLIEVDDGKVVTSRKSEVNICRILKDYHATEFSQILVEDGIRILKGEVIGKSKDGSDIRSEAICNVMVKSDRVLLLGPDHGIPVPTGAKFGVRERDLVKAGDIIAEYIDPYNELILAEASGIIEFHDITQGQTLRIDKDEESGTKSYVIQELKDSTIIPKIKIKSAKGEELVSYALSAGSHLVVEDGQEIQAGKPIVKISRVQAKTKDITGGLPRVAELFEARKPKDHCILAEQDGIIDFGERQKGRTVINIIHEYPNEDGEMVKEPIKHVIPGGRRILVRAGEFVNAGTPLCDGPINPHDILRIEGDQVLMEYLINEILEVYRLQGVNINDKHVGIIIRQMLRKVEITDVGDATEFIIGQQVDKFLFREVNNRVIAEGGKPASARSILLGITKASLTIESFISAASFQETTKVLTNAAIKGKVDYLRGLKENVIIGHLIPAGTGIHHYENIDVVHHDRIRRVGEPKATGDHHRGKESHREKEELEV